ncbi:hypothetical protein [Flavihumibacter sp. CACIAM 22H1]|uniref:hypothetical protein n=1 Tax=Flavihumibacter sp. CACIAM 22H1 TaxID=1812911 RepID=UPI0007A8DA9A|nr:hypothetical protein [Flavihumibacter sp. CACIAM 22H1]KYP14152.1 MAG: hypothetical protein A1D16_07300 [Flavihumibacter sp. CACIAM 22H1]
MKKLTTLVVMAAVFFSACSKSDDKPGNSRDLVYEFTGTYTGSLNAVYTNANGTTVTEIVNALPWKKEVTLAASVRGAGFSFSPVVGKPGVTGQTMTMRLTAGGKVKDALNGTADANGYILTLGTMSYVVQ